jgi:hypothetical protein
LTWPLAIHAAAHVPGAGAGDNVAFLWNFWWMRHAWSSGERVFHTTYLFYPFGTDLVLHTHMALAAFVGATILSPVSIVTAQNLTIIASYALNGFATYLLAWHLTRKRGAAIVAGVFFSAAPYFAGHLNGHFNLVAAWPLPLFALAWLRALDSGSRIPTVAAAAILVIAAFTDYYYTTYICVFAACVLASRWLDAEIALNRGTRRRLDAIDRALVAAVVAIGGLLIFTWTTGGGSWTLGGVTISMKSGFNLQTAGWIVGGIWLWRGWRPRLRIIRRSSTTTGRDLRVVLTTALVVAAGTAPIWLAAIRLWRGGGYVSQQYFWRSAPPGIDLAGFLSGSPSHPIWGPSLRRLFEAHGVDVIEQTAWFGLAPIACLVATRSSWLRNRDSRFWIGIAVVFLIWSLGPYLRVVGFNTALPLPAILLRYVPIVANARIPGRAIVMVYLAVSMLLATAIGSSRAAAQPSIVAAICLAILLDFAAVPYPLLALDRPVVYQDLAGHEPGAVIELPFGVQDGFGEDGALDHRTLYYQSIHGRPIVGGLVSRLPESVKTAYRTSPLFGPLLRLSAGDRDVQPPGADQAGALLRRYGIRYVVLNTRRASDDLQRYARSTLPIVLVRAYADGRELYEVR